MTIPTSLRHELRRQTDDLHRRLDGQVGDLQVMADYHRYLTGSLAFRLAIETALAQAGPDLARGWQIVPIASALRADLADLGIAPVAPPPSPDLRSEGAQAAAVYVIEGSALGARLIARRAAQIGCTPTFGARHLAVQTGDPDRWRACLAWLDEVPTPACIVAGHARRVFETALHAYGVAV